MRFFADRTAIAFAAFMPVCLASGCGSVQEPTPVELPAAEAFPVAFGTIAGVRELADGRVLVSDPLGQALVRIDFTTGVADTIGRTGAGPDEIGQPDALFPLRADTSLLVDLGNARLARLGPNGNVISTHPMGQTTASGETVLTLPSGVDETGNLYFRSERNPLSGMPNSTALLRFRSEAGLLDTLTMLRIPELGPPPLPGGGGMGGKALQPVDEWAVGPGGEILVVRAEDRTTLRLGPDGRWREGPVIPARSVPVGEPEKLRWLADRTRSQVVMSSDETGTIRARRGDDNRLHADLSRFEWPAELPLILPGGVHIAPSGEAWLERYVAADQPPLVIRLNHDGQVIGATRLPPQRKIAGFGEGTVFLVHTDEFGLERIERYPLPRSGPEACTGFVLRHPEGITVGKNLDWAVGEGILVVNERGVEKDAWNPSGRPTFSWIARFGSVTFNQFGWGFPLGGMNEAGLVVEEMSYSPTRYPEADARPGLSEFQWIQYQLDRFASVEEVLAGLDEVRIEPFLFGLHFLIADRTGDVAVIEFLNGNRTVHYGEDMAVPVLANDTYGNSLRYLEHHRGFGGERVPTDGPESPERFVRAAMMVRAMETGGHQESGSGSPRGPGSGAGRDTDSGASGDPVSAAFTILDVVRQDDTQWTIVYGVSDGSVHFEDVDGDRIRSIRLSDLDFSCRSQDRVIPLREGLPTVAVDGDVQWGVEENEAVLKLVFRKLGEAYGEEALPEGDVIASLAAYPATARCGG